MPFKGLPNMASLDSEPTNDQNELDRLRKKVQHLELSLKKQQKKAQKKINSIRRYYESMLSIMPGHVYWLDKHNRYLGCNDLHARNVNLPSRQAIIGKTNYDLTWKEQAAYLDEINDQVMATGIPLTLEEFALTSTGLRTFLSHKAPLFNDANEIIGLIGVSVDMTDQKETEKRLAEALELAEVASHTKNAFIANMSHDIRTPLSGIIGMSSLLQKKLIQQENKQYAEWIYQSGQQLLEFLNHILELVSSDNIKDHLAQTELFSLQALVSDIIQLEQPSVHLKNILLQTHYDSGLPKYLYGDKFKIHRILLNLIGNAVKFTHQGRIDIDISLLQETDASLTLLFKIKDTGIGIPESAQAHIFERFFRAHPSDKGIYPGSGIGLHMVKTYIDTLDGKISLKSEENKGTEFSFVLSFKKHPNQSLINQTHTSKSLAESQNHVALPSLEKIKFLLVEDNLIALRLLEQLVEKLGSTCFSSPTAEDAWLQLQHHHFDVLITDIGLPGMSGIELTKQVRKHAKFNHIHIVGLTAHTNREILATCLEAGMSRVLMKPIELSQLQETVEQLLNEASSAQIPDPLGQDLPSHPSQLFELSQFPLLDIDDAIQLLGDETILKNMLGMMVGEQIPHDLPLMKKAFEQNDWQTIEKVAHKMKAGALYCGTKRLQMACQYLERYIKAGHTSELKKLYQQLMQVMGDTIDIIQTTIGD